MTTTTRNEAAERLYALFGPAVVLEAAVDAEVERIMAEGAREAVERIRAAVIRRVRASDSDDPLLATVEVYSILNKEAAR